MSANLNTIGQAGLKALLKERITQPEKYVNTPLIIWRADVRDGIQERLLDEVFNEYNLDGAPQLWYKMASVGTSPQLNLNDMLGGSRVDRNNNSPFDPQSPILRPGMRRMYTRGLIVLDPIHAAEDYARDPATVALYQSVVNDRHGGGIRLTDRVPLVAYMCNNEAWFETPEAYPEAEQYQFQPDFDEWAQWATATGELPQSVIDYIRGEGNKDQIAFRWYNHFRKAPGGCPMPIRWTRPRRGEVPWDAILAAARTEATSGSGTTRDTLERKYGGVLPPQILDDLSLHLINHYR